MASEETNQAEKDSFLGKLVVLPWPLILRRSCAIAVVSCGFGLLRNWIAVPSLPWIYERPVKVEFTSIGAEQPEKDPVSGQKGDKEILLGLDLEEAFEEFNFGGVFLDARDTDAYMEGHIRNAVSLPVALAENRLPTEVDLLDRDDTVIVYCDESVCDSSEELGLILKKRYGFKDVRVFRGGWEAWRDAGYPTDGWQGGPS